VPSLTRCGVAAGADILFIETHYEPARAKSDAGSQLPFEQFDSLVENAVRFRELYLEMTS
jgi:2-dehydro-3-deoxyphosphooctonate aldolase (KDO 8-P synthase)